MTTISRTVTRETLAKMGSGPNARPLIVELHRSYVVVRVKGIRKSSVAVDYTAIWDLGCKLQAREPQKLAARKLRK
jgi:hypothetical protein